MQENTEIRLSTSDKLALDRTHLANERTFLAYVRTFIGMLSAGIAILKVFDFAWTRPIAYALLICSIPMLAVGLYRYRVTDKDLKNIINGNANQ
ncbi:MAG: DUF202 domain-containing protein [Erysipelotrichaceae bacterium]|nr:DUF202 domain-containing protein [Erysipelotrichaceae bacterium]